jgi:trigger factor
VIEDSKIEMPKALIENEIIKMEAQFTDDITKMGLKLEDYLKHIKKTIEELKKEWTPDAEKRAKLQIILQKIAIEEKLKADKEEIEKETAKLIEYYKGADPERARAYVESQLINDKVWKFLEEVK